MKNIYLLILLATVFCTNLQAQAECDGSRYYNEIFSNVTSITDTVYGQNFNVTTGGNVILDMDIYFPQGDVETNRPVLLMAHGGNLIAGDKADADVKPFCISFAKRGYVAVSFNYRVGMNGLPFPGPNGKDAKEALLRAVHDAKAAVRFLYKNAANGNSFGIDTNRIIMGGSSAGAFVSLHYAYLDEIAEVPTDIDTTLQGMGGGLEGLSGNPGYGSEVIGVVNMAGALADTAWMIPGDQPVVSAHDINDAVVPYGSQMLTLLGFFQIMQVDGSSSVHQRANEIGIENCFQFYNGSEHPSHLATAARRDTVYKVVSNFLGGLVCNTTPVCFGNWAVALEDEIEIGQLNIYPNPSNDLVNIELPDVSSSTFEVEVFDQLGRVVLQKKVERNHDLVLNKSALGTGIFFIRVHSDKSNFTGKLLFR